MLAAERQARIRSLVDQRSFVSVRDLCALLAVSEITIRRDLTQLEQQGRLRRTHGGAISLGSLEEVPYVGRTAREIEEKRAIGRRAAALIPSGEIIFLNAGSTIMAMAHALAGRRDLTVVTNAYTVIPILASEPGIELVYTGGVASPQTGSAVGSIAQRMVGELHIDRAFLGATGVNLDIGITNSSLEEAALQRVVMQVARETYVLADHTKFGHVAFAHVAPLARFAAVITDSRLPATIYEAFANAGVRLIQSARVAE